jgi:hypothetical protein
MIRAMLCPSARRVVGPWLALVGLLSTTVAAHDLERTTVHLTLAADGTFALRLAHDPAWLVLRLERFAAAPGTAVPADAVARDAQLRGWAPLMIDRVVLWVDGQEVRPDRVDYTPPPAAVPAGQFALAAYTLHGRMPAGARSLRWYYGLVVDPYPLTVTLADGSETTEWVQGDAWSTALPLGGPFTAPSRWVRLRQYLGLGYVHILPRGLDHILFVLGLFLLQARLRPVLVQVTTFTVAHSLTLALSFAGVVTLPSRVVEPLIALSIVYVAVENLRASQLTGWRIALVFAFGLLHGLGFAGVLTALDLPRADFVLALAGFNLGVEAGQLTVIGAAALAVGWWRNRPWYQARIVVPASLAIAAVGGYWTVTRLFGA